MGSSGLWCKYSLSLWPRDGESGVRKSTTWRSPTSAGHDRSCPTWTASSSERSLWSCRSSPSLVSPSSWIVGKGWDERTFFCAFHLYLSGHRWNSNSCMLCPCGRRFVDRPRRSPRISRAFGKNQSVFQYQRMAEGRRKTDQISGHGNDDMTSNVNNIQPAEIKVTGDGPLNPQQTTAFGRLVMQMRWPAQHVLPEFMFIVSELAQVATRATGSDWNKACKVWRRCKIVQPEGKPRSPIIPWMINQW